MRDLGHRDVWENCYYSTYGKDAAQRLIGKAVEIQERALEYEKLVNVRLGVVRSQLELFMTQITVNTSYSKAAV
jgi:hypothetical protein